MNCPTTSAFDLPGHLAAKADPALIAGDERHFAAIAESLERSVADLSGRLDAELKAPGGIGQAAMDRDMEIHRLAARLRTLRRFGLDLCLGRMVSADNPEPVYVGRLGLRDSAGRRLLVDWRSPVAWPHSRRCRAWVAPKNGSATGDRQSTSSRRPALSLRPSRPTYTGSGLSALTMRPRHRSKPKRRRARRRAASRWISMSRSIAAWPMPPGALRSASRRPDRSATDRSRLSAMASKCRSSPAISAGSALAARWPGRSNALVVGQFTSFAPI